MKVLGIDPGTAALGYGIVERTGGRLREIDHGCLTTSADLSMPERLLAIQTEQASIRADFIAMRVEMSEMRIDLSDGQTVLTEMVMQLMKDMVRVKDLLGKMDGRITRLEKAAP